MNNVSFKTGLKSEWEQLKEEGKLDMLTLYFCVDTHQIYKGSLLFGAGEISNLEQQEDTYFDIYGGSATDIVE